MGIFIEGEKTDRICPTWGPDLYKLQLIDKCKVATELAKHTIEFAILVNTETVRYVTYKGNKVKLLESS